MPGTVFVQSGQDWVVDKIQTVVATEMEYLGWGTGTTDPVVGNTGLETPAAEARTLGVMSQPAADTHRVVGTITCAGTGKTISEVALFDAAAAGVMMIRSTFTGIPLLVGDRIEFTLDLQVT